MNTPRPGFVDFYIRGCIIEVEEGNPEEAADVIWKRLCVLEQTGDPASVDQLLSQHNIRKVGLEAENGTKDVQNPLWLKVDTSRRLVGTTGKPIDSHVSHLIHSAGIVGDGRTGNPVAFCVPNLRTGNRILWHIDPREIEKLSRHQIEDRLVCWVTQALQSGKLPTP